jgi:hypothetical protein
VLSVNSTHKTITFNDLKEYKQDYQFYKECSADVRESANLSGKSPTVNCGRE